MTGAILLLSSISMFRMGGDITVPDAPNGAVLRTMGGNIRVTRGAGKIVAKTMGGDIEIESLDGSADAGTMGGEIRVNVIGAGAGHDLRLRSMGGDIELTLPRDFSGEFDVEIEEGDGGEAHHIRSDFPLRVSESTRWRFWGGEHALHTATGRNGSAANRVTISTKGSNIEIRRK